MLETLRKLGTGVLVLIITGTLLSAVVSVSTTASTNTTVSSPVTSTTQPDCLRVKLRVNVSCPQHYVEVNACEAITTTTPEPGTADNTTTRAPETWLLCKKGNETSQVDSLTCPEDSEKVNGNCTKKQQSGLSTEVKIGIGVGSGVGGLVIIIIIVVLAVCLCRRRSHLRDPRGIEELSESRGSSLERETKPDQKRAQGESSQGKKTKVEEVTYVNVQSQSIRTSSIEHGHDKMFRYVKDPTLKKTKADPESEELKNLPEAPPPPVIPDQQEYEIRDTSSNDKISQKKALKPNVKVKPAAKPNQARRHQTTTLKQGDATGLVDSKSKSASLPMFPIEEVQLNREEMKKKEEAEKKTKKEEDEKQRAEERRKKATATAAAKKGMPQPVKSQTPPDRMASPSNDDEEENLPDYENEGTVTLMRQKAVDNQTAKAGGGMDNPAMADDPQEEYGNQAAVEEAARQRHGNSTAGEIYMPMDGMGGALGGVDDEPTDVYENKPQMRHDEPQEVYENGHEEGDGNVYQNVNFPANTR